MKDDGGGWPDNAVGHRWLLINLRTPTADLSVVPSLRECWLDLGRNGRFGWFDSVNYTSGSYKTDASSVILQDAVSTAAGYDGSEPNRTAAIQAFGTLVQPSAVGMTSPAAARIIDALLEITANGTTLIFRRAGTLHFQ